MYKTNRTFSACKIFLLSIALICAGCGAEKIKLAQIAFPQKSEKGVKYPEFNTEIDLATQFIVIDLRDRTGKVDTEFFTLTQISDINKIAEFYDAELLKFNFRRTSEIEAQKERTKTLHYVRSDFLNEQKVVVVLIEVQYQPAGKATADKYQFLMVGTDAK